MHTKNVLIGIDGVSFTRLKKISDEGYMPNVKALRREGVFKQLMATIPDNSAVSWSSIMTGDNPGEHGIFGFTDLIPNTYTVRFPTFLNIKSKPFWFQKPGEKYVIINLPFTYPVKEMNGYIISGFVSPDINRAVFPKDFLHYLKKIEYQTDIDVGKVYKSKDLFLDELHTVLEKRIRVYRKLWKEVEWDTFMVVFTGSDRLEHFMLDIYEKKILSYYDRFLEYFTRVDEEIGWIANRLSGNDNLLMMSDHGMELIKTEVHINTCLEKEGYLKLSNGKKKDYNNITKESTAFSLDPGRIYLHFKKKYPNGSVRNADKEKIIFDITKLFKELTYDGENAITDVIRKEEIYKGNHVSTAPDLLLVPNKGYSLRGTIGREQVFGSESMIKGMHRGSDAFLYVKGKNAQEIIPDIPKVEDIIKIMNELEEK